MQAPFALYVSCVDGQPVMRFGTRTLIGAMRRLREPTVIDYDVDAVVAIPHDEFNRYRREYNRALSNGSLRRRTADDWRAQNEKGTDSKQGGGTPPARKPAQE